MLTFVSRLNEANRNYVIEEAQIPKADIAEIERIRKSENQAKCKARKVNKLYLSIVDPEKAARMDKKLAAAKREWAEKHRGKKVKRKRCKQDAGEQEWLPKASEQKISHTSHISHTSDTSDAGGQEAAYAAKPPHNDVFSIKSFERVFDTTNSIRFFS